MEGPAFYDDPEVFATYASRRSRTDSPNDLLEKPVLLELIGNVRGLRILDLGCGDAAVGVEFLAAGASAYLGIEGSHNMHALARQTLAGTTGQAVLADIQDWDYPEQAFDLVLSRLVLHYLPDLDGVLRRVYRALAPGGRLVFSVEHPVITSCDRAWQTGLRQEWTVDDYFITGERVTEWMGGQVVKYHRTVEDYFTAMQVAGFTIQSLRESRPQPAHFASEETYRRRLRIPLFLFIAAGKPAG